MFETIISIIGTLGGWEAVKYLLNRKSNQRTAEAEADHAEFSTLKDTIEFLQQQLKDKEQRFSEQTDIVRKLNIEIIELLKAKGSMEVELVSVRCDDAKCPFRQPPNASTPPRDGLTIEQYQSGKEHDTTNKITE